MHDALSDVERAVEKLVASEQSVDITRMHKVLNQIDALWARTVDEFDRSDDWAVEGFMTSGSAIRAKCRIEPSDAKHALTLGRKMRKLPHVSQAFMSGELSRQHATVLANAYTPDRAEALADIEEDLTDLARKVTPKELGNIVRRYTDAIDGDDGSDRAKKEWGRRRFHISKTLDGMYALNGLLDPVSGETVVNALAAVMGPPGKDDDRTPEQRRADGLVDLCSLAAKHAKDGNWVKPRADFSAHVDLSEIERRAPSLADIIRAEAVSGHGLSRATLRMLTCDCHLARVITDGPSQVLDVGRATNVWPPAIRRAIEARDGGCSEPRCDRPPECGDIHHIWHWDDGGPTSMHNGRMLCRHHHIKEHLNDRHGPEPP